MPHDSGSVSHDSGSVSCDAHTISSFPVVHGGSLQGGLVSWTRPNDLNNQGVPLLLPPHTLTHDRLQSLAEKYTITSSANDTHSTHVYIDTSY